MHCVGVLKVTFLEFLERWFASQEKLLTARGISSRLSRSPEDGRPKAFRGVSLSKGSSEGELLLWDTGEAELNLMLPGRPPSQDHLELGTTDALAEALTRLLEAVASAGAGSGQT